MGKLSNTTTSTSKTSKKTTSKKKAPPRQTASAKKENTTVIKTKTEDKDKEEKLPRHARVEVQFRNIAGRLTKRRADVSSWNPTDAADIKGVATKMEQAEKLLTECADELAKLPDDYAPKTRGSGKGASSKAQITEGSKVKVREDRHEKYDGLLPLDDEFEVLGFRKRNVKIRTAEGPLFVPRGDLVPVVTEAA